ncbi:MAG: IclR family transcriptional regulator [Thermoplasmata archaeon]|nr:IclR family transcriptional regulator [Thermoplasmata archaeon]
MAIQAIERAAGLLRELERNHGLGLNELCERIGLAKGTTHGLLKALEQEGLVTQDPSSNRYQLGPALLQLGRSYLDVDRVRSTARGWCDRLAKTAGEEVRVAVRFRDHVLLVHEVAGVDAIAWAEIGSTLPLHATALGKCLLAYGGLWNDTLEAFTPGTIVQPSRLSRELANVLSQSWAVESEEFEVGVAGVAGPVFDAGGAVAAAVGVRGPVGRLLTARGQPRAGLAMQVCSVARGMSRDLGAGRWPIAPERPAV